MTGKKWFLEIPSENKTFYPTKEDRAKGVHPYVFTEDIAIAINVAYISNRPLLVEGSPGCGKSRLAEALAAMKGWHFLNKTITSHTTLEDLTNEYDHLRRLHDAYAARDGQHHLPENWRYNRPGVFWWAFNHQSASKRGQDNQQQDGGEQRFKGVIRPQQETSKGLQTHHTVLLLDEIDKAEPDLPNDLLDIIERRRIELTDGTLIDADESSQSFVIITSNRERKLPSAFLRRCVSLYIDEPDEKGLMDIALSHMKGQISKSDKVVKSLIDKIIDYRDKAISENLHVPGTSEFLDALKVCKQQGINPSDDDPIWIQVEKSILRKLA